MTMYSPLVYAQVAPGAGYAMPPLPPTFGLQAFTPPNFNPSSATAADRTVYFVDSAGTLTEAQARLACYGLSSMQATQIAAMSAACGAAIAAGFGQTVDGAAQTVTLSDTDQRNLMMAATTAQAALQLGAWEATHAYGPNSVVVEAGEVYVTFAGGTSGTAAPTWPTAFQTAVTDGTVTWYKVGYWVGMGAPGNVMVDAPTVIAIYAAAVAFISAQRSKYQVLKAAILAATTPEVVMAVAWS